MSIEGEYLPKPQMQALHLRAHPFAGETGMVQVQAGQSIEQMLLEVTGGRELSPNLAVRVNGYDVPAAWWPRVRPKAGALLNVTHMPAGSTGKKILRTILTLVVMVVSLVVTTMFGPLAGALVSMIGNLIVNALLPPPKPPKPGDMSISNWNQLTSTGNQINPYGVIPLVLGECRIFPTHAAMPYSETVGETSYQRLLFDLGYGDIEVSDLKIGDTPMANFEEVEYEIGTAPSLYTNDVNELAVNATLNDGDVVTRTTAPDADEITLDIVFPQGLFGYNKDGKQRDVEAQLKVEYRAVGASTWIQIGTATPQIRFSGFKVTTLTYPWVVKTPGKKPFAVGVGWRVDPGQYEVRVTRGPTFWNGAAETSRIGDAAWGALRTIRHVAPSTTGTTKLGMRIKSSEQLNGALQTLSCLIRQRVKVWTGTAWTAPTVNLNPAWVLYWLLTECPAVAKHVPPERIDLASFKAFADFCTAHDFETRAVIDYRTTGRQIIDDLLSNAGGALTLRDGKYGIIFDDGTATPVMAFTPLDIANLAVSRPFIELPHALKVRFKNPAADWEVDEIIVLDDGYSNRGVDARGNPSTAPEPTLFETLELRFAADAITAWRLGRFHFAQAKYRPNTYTWETDVANLACSRGDVVLLSHDVTEWGDGWGRVVSLVGTTLKIDQLVDTATGTAYSVRIRRDDGSTVLVACTPAATTTDTFTLASAPTGVNPGDVVTVGETGTETRKLYITGVTPGNDLSARITAVDYSDAVYPFWQDPPASIVSEISGNALSDPPAAPNIVIVISDQVNDPVGDTGVSDPTVHINIGTTAGGYLPVTIDRPPTLER